MVLIDSRPAIWDARGFSDLDRDASAEPLTKSMAHTWKILVVVLVEQEGPQDLK